MAKNPQAGSSPKRNAPASPAVPAAKNRPAGNPPKSPATPGTPAVPPARTRGLFTWPEWIAAGLTLLVSGAVFLYYMSPEVTFEDSGELVTGAFNFGVPHPPGYPLWALLGWIWRHLVPFGNPARRIGLLSVLTGAALVGIMTLLMSRSILMLLRGSPWFASIEEKTKESLSLSVATATSLLFAFNRGVWLWACVPEMRVLNQFLFVLLTCVFFAWVMRPERSRYLFATLFLLGISIANHQTIVAMALPLAVGAFAVGLFTDAPANRRRFAGFLEMTVAFLVGWSVGLAVNAWLLTPPDQSLWTQTPKLLVLVGPMLPADLAVSLTAGAAVALLVIGALAGWLDARRALACAVLFLLGTGFYFYMAVASSTNPPMNWGYCSTRQGFLHCFTRGQYEQLKLGLPNHLDFYIGLWLFTKALVNQYSLPVAAFGLVPLVAFARRWTRLNVRAKQWLIFVAASFVTTSFGLLIVINPGLDKTQQEINLKFFAPAHGYYAMFIGYGLAYALAAALTGWPRLAPALTRWPRLTALAARWPQLPPATVCRWSWALVGLAIIPLLINWKTCEQRGHDFAYQFGYRMFNPGGQYRPMDRDAFLFGGTDPGRFVPTYMIFCESRVAPRDKFRDPNFDRRDVYIVTQNALADTTYMSYIRDHYDYSRPNPDNPATLAKFEPWQRSLFRWAWHHLHRDTMYPVEPLWIPAEQDSQNAFRIYVSDVMARRQRGEPLDPEEDVQMDSAGRVTVRGVKGVMNINAILCKWIHDHNKAKHAFYVEESYVIPWMFPYFEPYGIILKLNPEPLPSFEENPAFWSNVHDRDKAYWDKLVAEFTARPEFKRDSDAGKTFSKLRSAIGGVYAYRKLYAWAEEAFIQSLKLCPESPEGNFRYSTMLMETGRPQDALALLLKYQEKDRLNVKIAQAITQVSNVVQQVVIVRQLEQKLAAQPRDLAVVSQLVQGYLRLQRGDLIKPLLDRFLAQKDIPNSDRLQVAQFYLLVNQPTFALQTLKQAAEVSPTDSEICYALAIVQGATGATNEAFASLQRAFELAPALRDKATSDKRLDSLRNDPRFTNLVQPR